MNNVYDHICVMFALKHRGELHCNDGTDEGKHVSKIIY